MSVTVVPTRATAALAVRMVATARREGSGAEAAILHLDDTSPDQIAALVACLLDIAAGRDRPRMAPAPDRCGDCETPVAGRQTWRGLCRACYDRHRYAGTVNQFPPRVSTLTIARTGPRRAA